MLILALTAGISIVAGLVAWLLARRWPRVDPAAPEIPSKSIQDLARRHRGFNGFIQSRFDPSVSTGFALGTAIVVLVVGSVGVALILVMIRSHSGLAGFDLSASRFGAKNASALSTTFLKDLSQLGGAYVIIPLAILIGVVETRRLRSPSVFGFLIAVFAGQFLASSLIKFLVGRTRPNIDRLAGFSGSSFPSGHATTAAACLAAFALVIGRRRSLRLRAILVGIAVGLAVAIALARVWLGVHWLTDVLGGLVLGWTWFTLCSIAFGGSRLRFGAPLEVAAQIPSQESGQPSN